MGSEIADNYQSKNHHAKSHIAKDEAIADAKRKKQVKIALLTTMAIVLSMLLGFLGWRIYRMRKAKRRVIYCYVTRKRAQRKSPAEFAVQLTP
ncbi:hypothetical protein CCACVL1_15521 [Corchorus capsularis]|uniref:Uncharacterized protein n=1 Tax=Corchorus capsularis TaxID=210143 RepID=A0A1R3I255_COCAP|nr:hypothetical protein CCACVL1_15521 [Corchorus capsularis]